MKHLKLLCISCVALLMMGNEGCEEKKPEPPKPRALKRQVELARIVSPRINLPGSENFDFEHVINAQIYDVIGDSDKFVVPYTLAGAGGVSPLALDEKSDDVLLSEWMAKDGVDQVRVSAAADPSGACTVDIPQMMIGGQIRSFEITGGGGLWFGFGPSVKAYEDQFGTPNFAGTAIDVQFAQMDMGLVAYQPLTKTVYGNGSATTKHTKVDINLSIDFGSFRLGPSFFFQSPLSKVTKKGLESSLKLLAEDMDKKASKEGRPLWETRVFMDNDTAVYINAGRRHGIKEGDEFAVYNLQHFWEDSSRPCASGYLGFVRRTREPVAILKATHPSDVGDLRTRLEVIQQDGTPRDVGAQVVVWKLQEDEPAQPKKK